VNGSKGWGQSPPANAGKQPTLKGPDAVLDPWKPDTATAVQSITGLNYPHA